MPPGYCESPTHELLSCNPPYTWYGILIVHAHVIKLRHRQVFAFPPFAAAVVRVPHPAIVSHEHHLRVGRIDPHIMAVAVRALKAAHYRKTLAGVLAHNQRAIGS